MSEQDKNNVQAENTAVKEKSEAASQSAPQSTESSQDKPQKSAKSAKGGKKSAAAARKEQSRLKKEWEESIVASKKVKQEEIRRKVKRAMLIMLVFSLIVTSIVYVMLLFIQENNIRITANNRNKEKSISLSMDNSFWTPYLNADGPDQMWNVSYDPRYTFVTEKSIRLLKSSNVWKRTKSNSALSTASNISALRLCSKTRATSKRISTTK